LFGFYVILKQKIFRFSSGRGDWAPLILAFFNSSWDDAKSTLCRERRPKKELYRCTRRLILLLENESVGMLCGAFRGGGGESYTHGLFSLFSNKLP
jgi:hypothetical protein